MLKCCESHGEVINTLILVTIYLSCLYVAWFVGESPKKIFYFQNKTHHMMSQLTKIEALRVA